VTAWGLVYSVVEVHGRNSNEHLCSTNFCASELSRGLEYPCQLIAFQPQFPGQNITQGYVLIDRRRVGFFRPHHHLVEILIRLLYEQSVHDQLPFTICALVRRENLLGRGHGVDERLQHRPEPEQDSCAPDELSGNESPGTRRRPRSHVERDADDRHDRGQRTREGDDGEQSHQQRGDERSDRRHEDLQKQGEGASQDADHSDALDEPDERIPTLFHGSLLNFDHFKCGCGLHSLHIGTV